MSKLNGAQNGMASESRNKGSLLIAVALVLLALFFATVLAAYFSSPAAYVHQFEVLEAKRDNAVAMTAASTTISAALTVVPDDVFTPIAAQLAEASRDFAFILGAIMLQEWLLTTLGFIFFGLIAPVCFIAFAVVAMLPQNSHAKTVVLSSALRVFVAVAVLWAAVPCSVFVTDKIEETHAASVESAINAAEQVEALCATDDDAESESVWANAAEFFHGLCHPMETVNSAAEKVSELAACTKAALGALFEGFAVMVVTTCVIPVLTPMLALWLVRLALRPALSQLQQK